MDRSRTSGTTSASGSRPGGSRRGREDAATHFGSFDNDTNPLHTPGGVPPLVLVSGPERVLAERAITATVAAARSLDSEAQVVRYDAGAYEPGALGAGASPSLFGGSTIIVVRGLEEASDALTEDLARYLAAPADGVTLVVWHKGGNRGKRVLESMRKAGARVLEAPAIKSDKDKAEFVTGEFRRAGRRIAPEAVRGLVEATGKDVNELAAACHQLVADTAGVVELDVVETYYGGRVEANGFRVADAALAGNAAEAITLVRHAVAVGTDPVPIVAALAVQVRQLVKVMAAAGPAAAVAGRLGMAPWQVDRARRAVRGWSEDGLASAIGAVAAADFEVKGGGRDPVYAVERCVLQVAAARRSGAVRPR